MRKALTLALFFCAPAAFANGKPQYTYQDGMLQGSRLDDSMARCIQGPGRSESTSCASQYGTVFIVTSGGATYILTPRGDEDADLCGLLLRATIPHNVLDKEPPRTPIKLRSDGKHFFVKVGARESEYSVARVE